MNFKPDNPEDDEILKFVKQMDQNLMIKRWEYIETKRKKDPKIDLDAMLEEITELDEYLRSTLKTHSEVVKFMKLTGQANQKYSDDFLNKMESIKSNVGQIISKIPKVNL